MSFRPSLLPVFRILILGLAPVLAACGSGDHPFSPFISEGGPEARGVSMGAGLYLLEAGSLGWSGELDFSITNVTDRTISLVNCLGDFALRLERWSGKEWEHAWSPTRRLCLSLPIALEPGETRDFDLSVFEGYPGGNSSPSFRVETIDGIYRLVVTGGYWDYTGEFPWGEPVPLKHLTSGPFRIRTVGP